MIFWFQFWFEQTSPSEVFFFFLQEGHIALVQKNYHAKPCHFRIYTKNFIFLGPICTEIWHFKVGWFWGGGNHLMIVHSLHIRKSLKKITAVNLSRALLAFIVSLYSSKTEKQRVYGNWIFIRLRFKKDYTINAF